MKTVATLLMIAMLFTSFTGCRGQPTEPTKEGSADALPSKKVEEKVDIPKPEMTFQIRTPGNRGDAVLIRLDPDRLRAYGLSKEDVMEAATASGLVGFKDPPPPGVVFNTHILRPDQYAKIILKANSEGEIVRLQDVAQIERLSARQD